MPPCKITAAHVNRETWLGQVGWADIHGKDIFMFLYSMITKGKDDSLTDIHTCSWQKFAFKILISLRRRTKLLVPRRQESSLGNVKWSTRSKKSTTLN